MTAQSLQRFIDGYAQLLGAPAEKFCMPGLTFIATSIRDLPEWANWIQPIWLFAFEEALICSVSPIYAEAASEAFAEVTAATLLSDETLARAHALAPELEWVRCELFYYPQSQPPQDSGNFKVEKLRPGDEGADKHLLNFDGGVYVIRGDEGEISAAAFIKNKGIIREIAVGTEEPYRNQGRAKAVVTRAIEEIVKGGRVATYWPDSFDNTGSYAVARSVGMVQAASMLFCAYEEEDWQGFEAALEYDDAE